MSKPPLTAERLRELFDYNPDTGVFTRLTTINSKAKAGDITGTKTPKGYLRITIDRKRYMNHRLAWLYVHGTFPENQIDHIDGGRANNRIENLRDVPQSTNMQNQKRSHKTNKLGLFGVHRQRKMFRAQITISGKPRHLGLFSAPEQAHAAYMAAKRALHPGCLI